ncbi:MAG: hypothetical protein KatS3mg007_0656 [Thermoanaerobaculum sp.]|nr:MAG: hypothetical protein KatS3mg007_0656 [Thermoanaerobaculum sp.]
MRWWRLVVLVCPLVMGGCQEESLQATRTPLSVKPLPAVDLPHSTSLHPGETLADMFGRLGLGEAEAALWVRQATTKLDPRRLPAWAPVVCYRLWGVELHELRLTLGWDELVLTKTGPGVVTAEVKKRPVTETVLLKGGAISGSLFGTVSAFGERDELAIALAEVFAWQVDFHRDLQPGDQVKVLFVRQESEGELLGYGPILAATLVNKGKEYRAFRYLHQGKAGYYDELGRPLKRQFLRSPLPYSRVTSGFSLSRRHPILGRRLPHFGVDYAAPEGTPVRATADGVVRFVGWKGGWRKNRGNTPCRRVYHRLPAPFPLCFRAYGGAAGESRGGHRLRGVHGAGHRSPFGLPGHAKRAVPQPRAHRQRPRTASCGKSPGSLQCRKDEAGGGVGLPRPGGAGKGSTGGCLCRAFQPLKFLPRLARIWPGARWISGPCGASTRKASRST